MALNTREFVCFPEYTSQNYLQLALSMALGFIRYEGQEGVKFHLLILHSTLGQVYFIVGLKLNCLGIVTLKIISLIDFFGDFPFSCGICAVLPFLVQSIYVDTFLCLSKLYKSPAINKFMGAVVIIEAHDALRKFLIF